MRPVAPAVLPPPVDTCDRPSVLHGAMNILPSVVAAASLALAVMTHDVMGAALAAQREASWVSSSSGATSHAISIQFEIGQAAPALLTAHQDNQPQRSAHMSMDVASLIPDVDAYCRGVAEWHRHRSRVDDETDPSRGAERDPSGIASAGEVGECRHESVRKRALHWGEAGVQRGGPGVPKDERYLSHVAHAVGALGQVELCEDGGAERIQVVVSIRERRGGQGEGQRLRRAREDVVGEDLDER
eukprot:CAMPEP_0181174524 /NCGR_PEP_ID=MMETSP1096-20121128/3584_1 /TAXON_ID=156174 ORGANISM="Chrysochromulina ericina, Strain CCMP281" /NCGR_SAMPLE_ID=MMETSP1096 /ASSEMBLY_ACC=CAM_ASM_000453 /LENGTH=243 /DNA_ID=CAMNT_0023262435 /DNA_START=129 /DNA_END=860 /DNA_ORIENTATION=+